MWRPWHQRDCQKGTCLQHESWSRKTEPGLFSLSWECVQWATQMFHCSVYVQSTASIDLGVTGKFASTGSVSKQDEWTKVFASVPSSAVCVGSVVPHFRRVPG